jgi:hypothetical protein
LPKAVTIRETAVRWSTGFFSSPGTLVLTADQLTLLAEGQTKFSIGKANWSTVSTYGAGAALKVKVEDERYIISFVPLMPNYTQRADGFDEASQWRRLLSGKAPTPESRGFPLLFKMIGSTAGAALGIMLAALPSSLGVRIFWGTAAVVFAGSAVMVFKSARR